MALRVIGVGVLTPVAMVLFSIPYGVVSRAWPQSVVAQEIALWAVIALFAGVAISAFVWARHELPGRYPTVAGTIYLLVFAVLWATALPAYFAASAGHTPSGTPIGSLPYAIACFAACVGVLAISGRPQPLRSHP